MADQPSSKQTFPDQGQGSCAPRVTTKLAQHGSDTRTCVLCLVAQCVQLFMTPGTLSCQAPHPWGFSRQEYWTGLTCPPPGDLPNPGIEPRPPALQADSLPSEPPGKPSLDWVAYPFSRGSSQPRNQTGVFYIAGGFFTSWATKEVPDTRRNRSKFSLPTLEAFRLSIPVTRNWMAMSF